MRNYPINFKQSLLLSGLLLASSFATAATNQYRVFAQGVVAAVQPDPVPTVAVNFTTAGVLSSFTAPITGTYHVTAVGAKGGDATDYAKYGGKGAKISCKVHLTAGASLKILVGQPGGQWMRLGAGGGGSFVTLADNTPLCIAGGGGGSGGFLPGLDSTVSGGDGSGGVVTGAKGSGGGGGLTGDGGLHGGQSFVNGGAGGTGTTPGGKGGGGAGYYVSGSPDTYAGGGGGGYSGGNGSTSSTWAGAGGTSFSAGTLEVFVAGFNNGNGSVSIAY